tara:strand:+ start:322 stop:522 length:201 start_codon:yes stop_codon:yes gene_type:complete
MLDEDSIFHLISISPVYHSCLAIAFNNRVLSIVATFEVISSPNIALTLIPQVGSSAQALPKSQIET